MAYNQASSEHMTLGQPDCMEAAATVVDNRGLPIGDQDKNLIYKDVA